jgi:RNA polymerase sigma-70 factor (TIGR02943 family)
MLSRGCAFPYTRRVRLGPFFQFKIVITTDMKQPSAAQFSSTSAASATTPTALRNDPAQTNPDRWVDEHGDCLFRYALVRVRRREVAEDLVQETLLAAIRSREKFAGRSSERSWLTGILKHKISDHFRKLGRETSFTDLESLADEFSEKFVPEGYWVHVKGPKEWKPESDEVVYHAEFWQTMRHCLDKLPERIANVFMLREMDEVESKEICSMLSISESNLWVMLHRARMALRECLEINWFNREK